MKVFIFIMLAVTLQNIAKANEYADHYNKNSVEYTELKTMNGEDMVAMQTCVTEAMNDKTVLEVDHFEATDSCINEVLGDIHN